MSTEPGVITINKDQYYKAYLDQRQKLHIHLVQQFLAKSEIKKQTILTKSAEIIDNFAKYRDAFLKNMPTELKATKVRDYIAKGTGDLQDQLKGNNEKALAGMYKIFQSEFERVHDQPKKTNDHPQTSTAECRSGRKIKLISKEKIKRLDYTETDGTARQLVDITNDSRRLQFEGESHQHSATKSKPKQENIPFKSSKKRKWDQFGSNMKENRNPLNFSNSKQNHDGKLDFGKNLPSERKNQVLSVVSINRLNSPKKPWMP